MRHFRDPNLRFIVAVVLQILPQKPKSLSDTLGSRGLRAWPIAIKLVQYERRHQDFELSLV
ncbi:hypothetical protein AMK30_05020 [Streptomyces sp. CB02460]|nr:hypothetical protein AMK30_05020 [Streptomyces sp. CB02460]